MECRKILPKLTHEITVFQKIILSFFLLLKVKKIK